MKLGIIGGSGLYEMSGLKNAEPVHVSTPFGPPSDTYVHGEIDGTEVYFLSRHGRGHRKMPSELNHKANIFGFKQLGVDRVVGVSAVGSLREDLRPRDILLPDQYFDRTKGSLNHTFFGQGIVAHINFAEPICADLRAAVFSVITDVIESNKVYHGIQVRDRGTYVNMEGPAFSTKAESNVYRQFGFDVIGMTSLPEAKLCREAEICYASITMVTDYDCWLESAASVSVEVILDNLRANTQLTHDVLQALPGRLPAQRRCACAHALRHAIITSPADIPQSVRESLAPIIGKYMNAK